MALQCGFNMLIINSPNQYVSTNVNLVMSFWFDEVLIQWCTTKDPNPCSARTCSLLPCKRNHRSIKFQWRSFCRLNIANNIKENKLNERSNNIAIHAHNSYSYNSPLEVWNHFIIRINTFTWWFPEILTTLSHCHCPIGRFIPRAQLLLV